MKRSYYLLGIVGTIVVVVAVFLFLRYRAGTTTPSGTENTTQNVGLPPTGTQSNTTQTSGAPNPSLPGGAGTQTGAAPRFGLVAQNPVLNYFVDAQNNAVLVQPDGQIIKITTGGQSTLSSSAIANLISAKFSYDGAKIIATFGNLFAPQGSLFDVAGKSWQPLSAGIESIGWSPNSYQIAYLNNKGGAKVLTTVDISDPKAKPTELLTLHAEDLELSWPIQNKIVLSDKFNSADPGSAWSFDTKQKTLSQIMNGAPGLEFAWDVGANMGLVFIAGAGGFGGNLSIINTTGGLINGLSIFTLPSKCTFNVSMVLPVASSTNKVTSSSSGSNASGTIQNYLYCAISRNADDMKNAVLPDDYEMKKFFTSDDFYRIDLANGNLTQMFSDQSRSLDAMNLKIFGNYLFFINRYDQKLYWASLK